MKLRHLLTSTLVATLAIGSATLATIAYADYDYDDRIEAKVYQDNNFDANVAKAVKILERKGYQVGEVDVDTRMGKPVLEIEAYKNHAEYDIVMSYPDLRIISERRDY